MAKMIQIRNVPDELHRTLKIRAAQPGHNLGGALPAEQARLALTRLRETRLIYYPHTPFLYRIWELRESFTAYDTAYVALAEALDASLIMMDERLAQAPGNYAAVELYR